MAIAVAPPVAVLGLMVADDAVTPFHGGLLFAAVLLGGWFAVRRRLKAETAVLERLNRLTSEAQAQQDSLEQKAAVADRIVSALPDPIVFLSRDRRVLRANRAAARITDSDLMGRDISDGIRDPDLLSAIDGTLADGAPRMIEMTLRAPVETSYQVRVEPITQPARASGKKTAANGPDMPTLLIDFQDVTNLVRSERMRADFVANVSHELRTPLTSLTGFIETLQGPAKGDPDAQDKFLTIMQEQANRMLHIIRDLLSLSRIEMDEHSPPETSVQVGDVMNSVLDTLRPVAEERGGRIEIDIPDGTPAIRGDTTQLVQVFQNLVENGLKYGGPKPVVTVTAKKIDSRRVSVSVKDTGPGIPAEHIPRLTERFYRVDAARSRALGGTGLGLAIVKHIVNRHRGRLSVTSEPGSGSSFTITLPIA